MESFILGFITSIVSYIMAYSYMSKDSKRKFNRYFANPLTDIIVTVSALFLAGGTASGLMTAIGLGFGISLALRTGKHLYGIGEN